MSKQPNSESRPKRVPPSQEPMPLERGEEVARAAAGAAVSAVFPVVGDAFSAYLGGLFPSIKERRNDAWLERLRSAVNWLLRNAVRLEDLSDNDEFHDIVCAATEAARRTHLDEKRDALRNAIMNAVLPGSPSQVKQHMFVRLVDELSELHLHLLQFFCDPAGWFSARGGELPRHRSGTGAAFDSATSEARLEAVLEQAFPHYSQEMPLVMLVIEELERRGFVQDREQGQPRTMSATTFFAPGKTFVTPLGGEFLRFIRAPTPRSA